jgi:hypothetical protein
VDGGSFRCGFERVALFSDVGTITDAMAKATLKW